MDAVTLIRQQLALAHRVLGGTMADVTDEQMDWIPPGIANPLGASYAHVVVDEDLIICFLSGQTPLFASSWADKTGLSEPMPGPGPEFANYGAWTRSVRVNLAQVREYEKAVQAQTDEYLAGLTPEDLDTELDMSGWGMGQRTVAWLLSFSVVGHINNLAGEISCLKGLQGAKGYPF